MPSMKLAWPWHFHQSPIEEIDFPVGLDDFVPKEGQASINVVLIHDVTGGRDATWSRQSPGDSGWYKILTDVIPQARVLVFGYDATPMTELSHMLDPETIEQHAEALLKSLKERFGDQNRPLNERSTGASDDGNVRNGLRLPLIIVAHGYGGLVYERALVSELPPGENFLAECFQLAFLLGTPHYDAGLGEWAIMCAKRRNIRCANDAQSQKWTENLKEFIATTRETQKHLREVLTKQDKSRPVIQIAGCFASLPVPGSKLTMSPEWAVMPEFTPISIDNHYFGLTHLHPANLGFKKVTTVLSSWNEDIQSPNITEHTSIGEHHHHVTESATLAPLDVPDKSGKEYEQAETLDQRFGKLNRQPEERPQEAGQVAGMFRAGVGESTDDQYHRPAGSRTWAAKRALLIGSQLNLVATTVDVQSMGEVLRSHGFITMTVGGPDRSATRARILQAIDTLTEETSNGDAVVVYYTGHGMITERNDDRNARLVNVSDNTDQWRLQFIVPSDFGDSTIGDFRGITDLELSQKLATLSQKTHNITLILDCCHSTRIATAGATIKSIYPEQYPRAFAHIQSMINHQQFEDNLYAVGNPSVVRIVAAEATEPAYEASIRSTPGYNSIHKSVLTEALVEALQHVVSKQIRMSWDRIMLRVNDRVLATMPTQHPGIDGPSSRFCFETEFELGLPVSRNLAGDYILQGGYLHGVTDKDKYAILPTEATTVQLNLQIAEAKVSVARDKDATLQLTWMGSHRSLPDRGAHAILMRRELKRSSVIIQMSGLLCEQLSDAVKSSRCLRIGHDIATQLACVKQEGHHVTLKDFREHTIRNYLLDDFSHPDIIPRGVIAILEALDRARLILGLKGAPQNAWPLQSISIEFGIANGGDVPRRPFQTQGEDVEEGQSVYFQIKNSGGMNVYVSVLDICLHHVTLCESNLDIPGGRTGTIGNTVAGTLKGLKVTWPPEVPRDQSIMVTVVIVLTDRETDLRLLETDVSSEKGVRNQKGLNYDSEGNDSMSIVDQIVRRDGPVPQVMKKVAAPKFGMWSYDYKLLPNN